MFEVPDALQERLVAMPLDIERAEILECRSRHVRVEVVIPDKAPEGLGDLRRVLASEHRWRVRHGLV